MGFIEVEFSTLKRGGKVKNVFLYPEDKNGNKLIWRMDHEAEAYRGNMERG